MDNERKINWFPGHMAKALRKTEEDVRLCDGVIYVLDARAPYASINDKLMKVFGTKPVVYALNKTDLAPREEVDRVVADFKSKNLDIQPIEGLNKRDVEKLKALCLASLAEKTEKDKSKGVVRTRRFMVAGIPNTGKSTIINTLAGGKRAETGDKAGVTRANKWIRLEGFDLLDTPGTMPPRMDNQRYAEYLALIGSINDEILDLEGLTLKLIEILKNTCAEEFKEKYKLEDTDKEPLALFEEICVKRGYIFRGGEYDYSRGAKAIITDFRKGKIAKVCLK